MDRALRAFLWLVSPMGAALLGCAGTVSSSADGIDAEASATTSAVISVERTTDPAAGSRAEVSARFLRVFGSSSKDALRAIGAALDLPAPGTCAALSSRGGAKPGPLPIVELSDVGDVSVEAAGVVTHLAARQLPDVTDVVSGVVYARGTAPALLPDSTPYVIRIAGSAGQEPVSVSAAGDPTDIHLAGENESGTLVATGTAVELSWPTVASDDVVYADIRPAGVRCALGGSGRGKLTTLLLDDAGTIGIHRLHRETLHLRGIDSAEIRFDFARTVPYIRN